MFGISIKKGGTRLTKSDLFSMYAVSYRVQPYSASLTLSMEVANQLLAGNQTILLLCWFCGISLAEWVVIDLVIVSLI